MIILEFLLRPGMPEANFEVLMTSFYGIGSKFTRRVDGETGTGVFSASLDHSRGYVMLLIDEDTPAGILTAIRAKANGIAEPGTVTEWSNSEGTIPGSTVRAPTPTI